jgi:hypothetical protein
MTVAVFGTPDLASISGVLVDLVRSCNDSSAAWNPDGANPPPGPDFTLEVSGLAPDAVRHLGNCQLTMYLFHVAADPFNRNQPLDGRFSGLIPYLPLGLNLFYLVTAYDTQTAAHEQRAMSIAMKCLHEHPIIKTNLSVLGKTSPVELTITLEANSVDEMSRLWQASTVAQRLSAVYRVGVAFLSPEQDTSVAAPPVLTLASAAAPGLDPKFDGSRSTLAFIDLSSTAGHPHFLRHVVSPAAPAYGQNFELVGSGLQSAPAQKVFLVRPSGVEADVTATWSTAAGADESGHLLRLHVPDPGPAPGVYQLRVDAQVQIGSVVRSLRSNTTPISVVPRVDTGAASPPLLSPDGAGLYTINGAALGPRTELLVGAVSLNGVGGAPAAGQFNVNAGFTQATFKAPIGLHGRFALRVRAGGVEAAPAWWIDL